MKQIFTILLSILTLTSCSQDLETIENKLCDDFEKINFWYQNQGEDSYDSIVIANERFRTNLLAVLNSVPQALDYEFPKLRRLIQINASTDKKLRTYSWDTYMGGTMKENRTVLQYKGKGIIKALMLSGKYTSEEYPLYSCNEIFSFINNGATIYIANLFAVYSTKDHYEGIKFFTIENNNLNDTIALIKIEEGLKNEFGISYDFFSVVDHRERPIQLIIFDSKDLTLKFPIIGEKEEVTDRFITFKFNGQYFDRK